MRSYPVINFSQFSVEEVCDFVSLRLHEHLKTLMNNIQQTIIENEPVFSHADQQQLFPVLFLQFKDECSQLMRMESFIFFPFLKQKKHEENFLIPDSIMNRLFKNHELITALFYRIKLSLNNFMSKEDFAPVEQIIINDLTTLEYLMSDWNLLCQNHIIKKVEKNKAGNEYS